MSQTLIKTMANFDSLLFIFIFILIFYFLSVILINFYY